ncbi:NTP transferase domain-containing protein [Micromonospora sp. NIE79]|uniref:NTP transferase domain-containing protein n=1 Tax=Micromonospora trifolii TaxID=2911208 RepID=A0ABS9NAG8_9ACTN|nr:NTP transferase domain-containing protein [Micromonospora trifolii]MCG5446698.1 NTP transferase domain-containing protein [Micromonospora trifolii]
MINGVGGWAGTVGRWHGYGGRVGTYAAVVLAGGAARRMGGVDKPALPVGGRPMRDRVLAAVGDATPRVLVGAADAVPPGVRVVREDPPGGGPVAAAAAGLALLDADVSLVALLAADLPLLTRAAIGDLLEHLDEETTGTEPPGGGSAPAPPAHSGLDGVRAPDGACFVDGAGRRQSLCGVWRVAALRAAVDRLTVERGGSLSGAPVRALLAGLVVREVAWSGEGPPPWFDCDTDEDVRRAEEWTR